MRVSPPKNKKLVNTGVSFIGVRPLESSILVFFNSGVGVLFDTRRKLRNPILGSILFKNTQHKKLDCFHGF